MKNAQPGGKGGGSTSPSGLPIRVASGREEGGYIDVEREQDGKRFRALHEPRRRGYVDRPTVIVGEGPAGRSREWVASNDALQNPTVAPIIRLLDAAQLSGQIRTIDMSTVIRNRYVGHEAGGYIRPAGGAESQSVLMPLVGVVLAMSARSAYSRSLSTPSTARARRVSALRSFTASWSASVRQKSAVRRLHVRSNYVNTTRIR